MNHLLCKKCEATYRLDDPRWKCDCGSVLDIEFRPVFDIKKIEARKETMWRYREAIPIERDSNIVSFDEGFTPLSEIDFDGKSVLIKQDHLFPAGSYKDRGASIVVSKVRELGIVEVVEDSSGNAACAVAAYCARAGIDCHIFVPESTLSSKLSQIQLYGASLNKISGSREDTAAAVMEATRQIYYASHSWNPFFFQGTKTFAYEVCEQLGWKAPDTLILPVGNGTLLLGAYIGFIDLLDAGITDKLPKIVAIQSANCAPLYRAFKDRLDEIPVIDPARTIAEGLAVAAPIRGQQIVKTVKATNGDFIVVSEFEIKESLRDICRKGFYIEATSAATMAGIRKYLRSSYSEHEIVVSSFTGHGRGPGVDERLMAYLESDRSPEKPQKIGLPTQRGVKFYPASRIVFCKAEGSYTSVYVEGEGKLELISKSLKEFEELLSGYNFMRTHRSFLVNLDHLKELRTWRRGNQVDTESGSLLMSNNMLVPVSRDKRKALLNRMSALL